MKYLLLLVVPFASIHAEVIMQANFEDEAEVRADWDALGSGPGIAIVSTEKASSGKRSLAIIDRDPEKYGAWQSMVIELPKEAIEKGLISISWRILYSVPEGQAMRLSVYFPEGEREEKSARHFNLKGDSEGWSESTFSEQRHEIPLPPNLSKIRIKFASNTSLGGDGEAYLDDVMIEY